MIDTARLTTDSTHKLIVKHESLYLQVNERKTQIKEWYKVLYFFLIVCGRGQVTKNILYLLSLCQAGFLNFLSENNVWIASFDFR